MGAKKKSETPVPKTEKPSKTPQPAPKTSTKDKDYSDSFLLWFQEPLEPIEVQIASRKRLLETFDIKSKDLDSEVKQNLLIRDQQINSLNKAILGLRAELKAKEEEINSLDHTSKLHQLQKQVKDLQKENEEFENVIQSLKDQLSSAKANWDDEKDSLLLQQEAVVEEQHGLSARIQAKEAEIREVKEDIMQMGKIMTDMNKLNHELHEKIQSMNENSEKMQRKYLKVKARAKISKELEEKIIECLEERDALLKKLNNWNDLFEKNIKTAIIEYSDVVKAVINNQGSGKSLSDMALIKLYEKSFDISEMISKAKKPETRHEQVSDLRVIFNEIKEKEKAEIHSMILGMVKSTSESLGKIQKESSEYCNTLLKNFESQRETIQKMSEKEDKLFNDVEGKEAEIAKLKKKIQNQLGRLDKSKKKVREMLEKEVEYKGNIKALQGKIEDMVAERKSESNQLSIREQRVRAALSQINILRGEIFQKDSEVIKKNKEILKLEKLLEEIKGQVQQVSSRAKHSDLESLKQINKEIDEKDKQIVMLKEMLRSSNLENKAKENEISHLKKKSESLNRSRDLI